MLILTDGFLLPELDDTYHLTYFTILAPSPYGNALRFVWCAIAKQSSVFQYGLHRIYHTLNASCFNG